LITTDEIASCLICVGLGRPLAHHHLVEPRVLREEGGERLIFGRGGCEVGAEVGAAVAAHQLGRAPGVAGVRQQQRDAEADRGQPRVFNAHVDVDD
jgi:hypothetical protein